jgi:NitT/TauT family transport system permease protein
LPYAAPDVVAGLRQSVTLAVVGAVLAEWFVADSGLGYLILVASENVRPDVMLASLSLVFVVGFSLYGAVGVLGTRVRRRMA